MNAPLGLSDVPPADVTAAAAAVCRQGYEPMNFRYSLFRPARQAVDAALTADFVVVSMVWPIIRSQMYRAASGAWVREFERDLLNLYFDRRATRRCA